MKFGAFLNQYHTPDGGFEAADLLEQAAVLEAVEFDSATVGERHLHEEGFTEPITALAALAARTESLTLGTAAMLPALHDPLALAEQVAMLDRLSGGRLCFGAALGYRERELAAFGVPLDKRVPRFIESLELLKRFWREERVDHDGDYWQYDGAFVSPRPAGGLPVWVGGHADAAIKRAAYRADGWIASASSTADDLERQIDVYESALEEFGHARENHEVVLMRDCYVADSAADARAAIEPHLLQLYRWYARWGQTYLDEHDVDLDYDEFAAKAVVGSPAACIEQLEAYEALGVDHVLLRCQFPGQSQASTLRCFERLGDEVAPAFG